MTYGISVWEIPVTRNKLLSYKRELLKYEVK